MAPEYFLDPEEVAEALGETWGETWGEIWGVMTLGKSKIPEINILMNNLKEIQDMNQLNNLTDIFSKIGESYTVTQCLNGFVVEVSGEDKDGSWLNTKYVVNTLEELEDIVEELARLPRS